MITQYIIDWGLLESLILISMIWFHLYQLLDTEIVTLTLLNFSAGVTIHKKNWESWQKLPTLMLLTLMMISLVMRRHRWKVWSSLKWKYYAIRITLFSLCTLMISTCICNTLLGIELNHELFDSYQKYIIQTLSVMYLFFRNGSEVCSNWSFWVFKEWGGRGGLNRI